jgi:hypothetical protein
MFLSGNKTVLNPPSNDKATTNELDITKTYLQVLYNIKKTYSTDIVQRFRAISEKQLLKNRAKYPIH